MEKEITKNEYFEMYVDVEINRVYWVMKGQWKKMTDIPDFLEHHREGARLLRPGFTALTDMRTFGVPAPQIVEVVTKAAKIMENAGMGRQAQVINKKDMEIIRASRGVMKEIDMDLKMMQFGSYEEAVEWLDR